MPRVPFIPGLSHVTTFVAALEFRTVTRWLGLALAVGLASGLTAAAFHGLVSVLSYWTLGAVANLCLLEPDGDHALLHCQALGSARPWAIVLLPTLGAGLAGWLVSRAGAAHEAHGTDALIDAFHNGHKGKRRHDLIKSFSSIIVMATGGSVGREGPMAVAGGALATAIGRRFNLSPRERRLLMLGGAAGGIGAIFCTPLGAALFVVEVLYRDDFEVDALVPTVLASVVGYSVFTMIYGSGHLFGVGGPYTFSPAALPLYLVMACACALFGALFIKTLRAAEEQLFPNLPVPSILKPAIGGLCVGLLGLWLAPALGGGYGWLQEVLHYPSARLPLGAWGAAAMLGIALLKILTTSLSIGSGAPGGIFGPSIVMGGMVGGAFGVLFHQAFPTLVPHPEAFAIVGMAAFVGGVAHAPISTLVMASEMTGSYDLLVPLMLCEVVTFTLMRPLTLYRSQEPTRRESGAHRDEYALNILSELEVRSVFSACQVQSFPANLPLRELLNAMSSCDQAVFPMLSPKGKLDGLITLDALRAMSIESEVAELAIAADCAQPFTSLSPTDTLAHALEVFVSSHCQQLPVSEGEELLGLLSYEDLLRSYNEQFRARTITELS